MRNGEGSAKKNVLHFFWFLFLQLFVAAKHFKLFTHEHKTCACDKHYHSLFFFHIYDSVCSSCCSNYCYCYCFCILRVWHMAGQSIRRNAFYVKTQSGAKVVPKIKRTA